MSLAAVVPAASPRVPTLAIEPHTFRTTAMGGGLAIHLSGGGTAFDADRDARRIARRIGAWASRITRHDERSDLSGLNRDQGDAVRVRPTLAAALDAAIDAGYETDGVVDPTLLDERLAAEAAGAPAPEAPDGILGRDPERAGEWWLERTRRGDGWVHRSSHVRFDLDGIGKGWIADRALRLLGSWPSAAVDADGDVALRAAPGAHWEVAVDDPRAPGAVLAVLRLPGAGPLPERWGVATSGTSVHRWEGPNGEAGFPRHHLIDPATGRPAVTDVVQATVITWSALRSEALAKAVVIAGAERGLALLDRSRVRGALLLTEAGETLALPETLRLLAE